MSPRRKRKARGRAPSALFTWGPHADDIQPDQTRDNPRARKCRACHALPGEPCTRPGRGGRVPIDGYHNPGRNRPAPSDQKPPATPPSAPDSAGKDHRQ